MKWSDEQLYNDIHEAICFDDDEDRALELLKEGVANDTINVNQTDEEGLSLLHHANMNGMEDVEAYLISQGAVED